MRAPASHQSNAGDPERLTRFGSLTFKIVGGVTTAVAAITVLYTTLFSPDTDLLRMLALAAVLFGLITLGIAVALLLVRRRVPLASGEGQVVTPAFPPEERAAGRILLLPFAAGLLCVACVLFFLDYRLTPEIYGTSQPTSSERPQLLRIAFPQLSGSDPQAEAQDHLDRGRKLYAQNDLDGSIREYRAALRLDPGLAAAHFLLGLALNFKGDTEGEVAEYRATIRINSNIADAHLYLGEALERKKDDLDGAISEYRAALRIYPDERYAHSFSAHSDLGVALWRKKDLDGSISQFRAAIRLKPDNPGPHLGLGMALEDKQLYEEAFEEYRRALTLDPKSKLIRDRYDYLSGFLGKK